jgi:hypothetical protein
MRPRGVLGVFFVLIAAYLVLIHFTGFAADIGAVGAAATGLTTSLQGR